MIQRTCMQEHQKKPTCQNKGLLLDKTQKEHYYEKNSKPETEKQHHESAKRQYCATYAKTNDEVNQKFGCKQNGERSSRCKNCMDNLCLWKEAYN